MAIVHYADKGEKVLEQPYVFYTFTTPAKKPFACAIRTFLA